MTTLLLQAGATDLICRPAISGHPSIVPQIQVAGLPVAEAKPGVDFVTGPSAPADRCASQTGKRPYNIIGIPKPPAASII